MRIFELECLLIKEYTHLYKTKENCPVKRIMADLQDKGMNIRKGNNRSGEWIFK